MPATETYDRPIRVTPLRELADLIPRYLERREADAVAIEAALLTSDMDVVRTLGHSMKGSGGGYGFDGITDMGLRFEDAGRDGDADAARKTLADLRAYLENVEVIYA